MQAIALALLLLLLLPLDLHQSGSCQSHRDIQNLIS